MNKLEVVNIIKKSINKHQTLIKLNWDTRTVGYRKLNKFIKDNNVDISHFETRSEQMIRQNISIRKKIPICDILISGSTYASTSSLKKRLYDEGLKSPICEDCGQDENWNGKKISMILDHINGIHDDNRIENLRILCPNCNASLPTHCGRNIKKSNKKRNKSQEELKLINKERSLNQRKCIRPTFEELKMVILELGYSATGRKYGVSDNTIRKWVKYYEKY